MIPIEEVQQGDIYFVRTPSGYTLGAVINIIGKKVITYCRGKDNTTPFTIDADPEELIPIELWKGPIDHIIDYYSGTRNGVSHFLITIQGLEIDVHFMHDLRTYVLRSHTTGSKVFGFAKYLHEWFHCLRKNGMTNDAISLSDHMIKNIFRL